MLMILDGWGIREAQENNAIALGQTPNWDRLWSDRPRSVLKCSGLAVGLPEGTMGNSEVGHLTIGAGRVIYQDFTRINKSIEDGSFFSNEVLKGCFGQLASSGRTLHLMGLCSDIGVHAHINHLFALLDMAKSSGVVKVLVHAITDGRDSPPDSGRGYIERVQQKVDQVGNAAIATVMGRYYAMDRDKRWDRVAKAYEAIVDGRGVSSPTAVEAVERSYAQGVTDEFIVPAVVQKGGPFRVEDGDAFVFFNFRSDRAREITRALAFEQFNDFNRSRVLKLSRFVCMTEYDETFGLPLVFPPQILTNIFGAVISEHGLKQLRIAETEKYAHVTFFFNGGEEKVFPGEDRCLIPSPRDVPTYDKKPEMSAYGVTDEVIKRIGSGTYDVIILNFANGDMVGHTGDLKAAIAATQAVDRCLGRIVPAVLDAGGQLLITADHGNCEEMVDARGEMMTAHSTNPVPLIYVADEKVKVGLRPEGMLADIAPTMLSILGIDKPSEMTGVSLLEQ